MATRPEASAGIDPLNHFAPFVPLLDGRPCGPGFTNEQAAKQYAEQQAMCALVNMEAGEILETSGKTPAQLEAEAEQLRAALRGMCNLYTRLAGIPCRDSVVYEVREAVKLIA